MMTHNTISMHTRQALREALAVILIVGGLMTGMASAMAVLIYDGIRSAADGSFASSRDHGDYLMMNLPIVALVVVLSWFIGARVYLYYRAQLLQTEKD